MGVVVRYIYVHGILLFQWWAMLLDFYFIPMNIVGSLYIELCTLVKEGLGFYQLQDTLLQQLFLRLAPIYPRPALIMSTIISPLLLKSFVVYKIYHLKFQIFSNSLFCTWSTYWIGQYNIGNVIYRKYWKDLCHLSKKIPKFLLYLQKWTLHYSHRLDSLSVSR